MPEKTTKWTWKKNAKGIMTCRKRSKKQNDNLEKLKFDLHRKKPESKGRVSGNVYKKKRKKRKSKDWRTKRKYEFEEKKQEKKMKGMPGVGQKDEGKKEKQRKKMENRGIE